jgi:polyhydroxybutyrate depolymerase
MPSAGAGGMSSADTGAPMPSPGCMSGSLMPGRTMGSIQSSGGNRTYILYLPASYDGKKPMPLVVDLHPYSVGASYSESSSGFRQLAATAGYSA